MNLYEECKESLGVNFISLSINEVKEASNMLKKHLNEIVNYEYIDFYDIDTLQERLFYYNDEKFVIISDNAEVPIFASTLSAIFANIYDIMALSPQIYVFNDKVLIHSLFPTFDVRVYMI